MVNGYEQDPIDGISLAYTFDSPTAKGKKTSQFFDNNGSRGIYHDGWFACTFGPLYPWDIGSVKGLTNGIRQKMSGSSTTSKTIFRRLQDLAAKYPEKLEEMKKLFSKEAEENKDFPIGAGIWLRLHPEDGLKHLIHVGLQSKHNQNAGIYRSGSR